MDIRISYVAFTFAILTFPHFIFASIASDEYSIDGYSTGKTGGIVMESNNFSVTTGGAGEYSVIEADEDDLRGGKKGSRKEHTKQTTTSEELTNANAESLIEIIQKNRDEVFEGMVRSLHTGAITPREVVENSQDSASNTAASTVTPERKKIQQEANLIGSISKNFQSLASQFTFRFWILMLVIALLYLVRRYTRIGRKFSPF